MTLHSSKPMAKVEQVCTHILVLDRGRLVAAGPIDEFIDTDRTVVVDVDNRAAARAALSRVEGLGAITDTPNHNSSLSVVLGTMGAADIVSALVHAGVRVKAAQSRHRLEDVFLTLVENPSHAHGTHMMPGIVPEEEEEQPTHA